MEGDPPALLTAAVKMVAKAFGSKASGEDVDAIMIAGANVIRDLRVVVTGGTINDQPFPGLVRVGAHLDNLGRVLDALAQEKGVGVRVGRIIDAEFLEDDDGAS